MASPLESFSVVRVSLMVRTKHATVAGASLRCAGALTRKVYRLGLRSRLMPSAVRPARVALCAIFLAVRLVSSPAGQTAGPALDRAAEQWVRTTLARMTVDEKVGQLLVSSFQSAYLSTDSDAFATLEKAVRDYHVG